MPRHRTDDDNDDDGVIFMMIIIMIMMQFFSISEVFYRSGVFFTYGGTVRFLSIIKYYCYVENCG